MAYCGIFYGTTLRATTTPYGATEWARAEGSAIFTRKIVGEAAFNWANANTDIDKLALMDHGLKYLDPWGNSNYSNTYDWSANGFGTGWHPGPSEAGDPSLLGVAGVYGYRMTDRHMDRFLGWCEAAMVSLALPCMGVFVDDCLPGRAHWNGAGRPQLWGAMNGRYGYDSASPATAYNWNLARFNTFISRLAQVLAGLGTDSKIALCNSGHSSSYPNLTRAPGIPWMLEGYQRWFTRAQVLAMCEAGELRAGDVLVLQGRYWNSTTNAESWVVNLTDESPEVLYGGRAENDDYEDIWAEALEDAAEFGLDIALGWHPETSEHATDGLDSSYSCLTDPSTLE